LISPQGITQIMTFKNIALLKEKNSLWRIFRTLCLNSLSSPTLSSTIAVKNIPLPMNWTIYDCSRKNREPSNSSTKSYNLSTKITALSSVSLTSMEVPHSVRRFFKAVTKLYLHINNMTFQLKSN
jgi:hypothetical protein